MKSKISTASLLLGGVCAIALAAPASAQAPEVRTFDIPGGELRQALDAYVRQSGAQLIYRVEDVRGTKTRGVAGALPADEALQRVLAGTPFTVEHDVTGALAVVAAPHEADFRVRPVATSAEYKAMEAGRAPLQIAFAILYLGFALIVLLAAIWTAIAVADRIVRPIRLLISAADSVATGNSRAASPAAAPPEDPPALFVVS